MMKALALLLLSCTPAHSQQTPKIWVSISADADANDQIGQRFVYSLKEEIARSSRFTTDLNAKGLGVPWLYVSIVSVSSTERMEGAISILVERETVSSECPMRLLHDVSLVGVLRVDEIAKTAMARLDATAKPDLFRRVTTPPKSEMRFFLEKNPIGHAPYATSRPRNEPSCHLVSSARN